MKVKINRNIGGHTAGDTIDVTPKTAALLETHGVIDKPTPKTTKKTDTKTTPDDE